MFRSLTIHPLSLRSPLRPFKSSLEVLEEKRRVKEMYRDHPSYFEKGSSAGEGHTLNSLSVEGDYPTHMISLSLISLGSSILLDDSGSEAGSIRSQSPDLVTALNVFSNHSVHQIIPFMTTSGSETIP